MTAATAERPVRPAWRYVARSLVTIGVLIAMFVWLLSSSFLQAFGCDDGCAPGQNQNWWGYTAQFVLAVVTCGVGVVALALGFTAQRRPYRVLLWTSLCGVLAWVAFVALNGSHF